LIFYLKKPKDITTFIAEVKGVRVGYLLIRRSGLNNYITEVIKPEWQNQGIGSEMIKFAQKDYAELTAEILVTNIASVKLHQKNQFVLKETTKNILIYKYYRIGPS
jgi:RimJ/RimL family protein N-acetyltransferase